MRIRELRSDDRPEWMRLLLELYVGTTETDHAAQVDAYLTGVASEYLLPSVVFVCERLGSGLCGFLELSVRNYAEGCVGPTPYVESWCVDADVRRTGIGRKLIVAAERWALAKGYTELASDAELDNKPSHIAHEAVGFVEEERVVHFRKKLRTTE